MKKFNKLKPGKGQRGKKKNQTKLQMFPAKMSLLVFCLHTDDYAHGIVVSSAFFLFFLPFSEFV